MRKQSQVENIYPISDGLQEHIMAYNLPLIDEKGLPTPNSTAEGWDKHSINVLKELGNVLKHESSEQKGKENPKVYFELTSIPDIWARVHVFCDALRDDHHPMHKRAKGEWRGLLALLALNSVNQLNISIERLEFKDHTFLETAGRYNPEECLIHNDPHYNWSEIGIIHIDGHPLGFMVPNLLVCPARNYQKALDSINVPLLEEDKTGKTLTCPTRKARQGIYLEGFSYLILEKYITELMNAITRELGNKRDIMTNRLSHELNDYAFGLKNILQQKEFSAMQPAECLQVTMADTYNCPEWGYYRELLRCWDVSTDTDVTEHQLAAAIEVRPEVTEKLGITRVIYLDKDLPDLLETYPIAIQLPFHHSFEGYLKMNTSDREGYEEKLMTEGILPVKKADLFTPGLVSFGDVKAECNPGDYANSCVPLTPLGLLLFTPDYLRENIRLDASSSKNTVSLGITMGNKRKVEIKHSYSSNAYKSHPLVIMQYPDFQSESIDYYMLGSSSLPGCSVTASLPVSVEIMKSALDKCNCKELRTQLTVPGKFNMPMKNAEIVPNSIENKYVAIYHTEAPPEYLTLTNRETGQFAGAIFCKTLPEKKIKKHSCEVSIDLGSSNTCIYWIKNLDSPDDTDTEAMHFDGHLISLLFTDDIQHYKDQLITFGHSFVPWPSGAQVPFMTSMAYRQENNNPGQNLPLMKSYIHMTAIKDLKFNTVESMGPNMKFDLKWDNNSNRVDILQDFLTQIAYQIAVQAAYEGIKKDNITWRITYPTTFPKSLKETYMTATRHSIKLALGLESPQIYYHTESWATAMYCFARNISAQSEDTMTIDIGGRTADITIWNAQKPVWNCSLDFGGQSVVLKYIASTFDHAIIEHRRNAIAEHNEIVEEGNAIDDLETLIKNKDNGKHNKICRELISQRLFHQDTPQASQLQAQIKFTRAIRPHLLLAFAGLLYYLGRVIKLVPSHHENMGTSMSICICGQGGIPFAKVLKEDISDLEQFFTSTCGNEELHSKIVFSNEPKHEVSFGALSKSARLSPELPDPQYTPLENIKVDNKDYFLEFPPLESALTHKWQLDSNFSEFRLFITQFSKKFDTHVIPPDYEKLYSKTTNDFGKYLTKLQMAQSKNYKDFPPEAPFITVLKNYLDQITTHKEETQS